MVVWKKHTNIMSLAMGEDGGRNRHPRPPAAQRWCELDIIGRWTHSIVCDHNFVYAGSMAILSALRLCILSTSYCSCEELVSQLQYSTINTVV